VEGVVIDLGRLRRWCQDHLGAEPDSELFHAGYLSSVSGLRLVDGREVVIKVRRHQERLVACFEAQCRLFDAGFPCPEPLVGPTPLAEWCATVERYLPGGSVVPTSGRSPSLFAHALAWLIATAPSPDAIGSLDPSPPWTAWDHDGEELWPSPDDRDIDLNAVDGPAWLDEAAAAVQRRLSRSQAPPAVGHGDFYAGNLRWHGDHLYAVHDWDSIIAAPETVIVGLAAAVFPAMGGPGEEATVDETAAFLAAYEEARGRRFSVEERQQAWMAGLWVRAFDAKKQFATNGVIHALDDDEAMRRRQHAGD
jgi:aminoglycoside phosphotransferase (APT) family kinase protein